MPPPPKADNRPLCSLDVMSQGSLVTSREGECNQTIGSTNDHPYKAPTNWETALQEIAGFCPAFVKKSGTLVHSLLVLSEDGCEVGLWYKDRGEKGPDL